MCDGTGEREITDDWGQKRKIRCLPCRGTGKVNETDTCNMCGGVGEIEV
jgi:RecJ-like exonuclease